MNKKKIWILTLFPEFFKPLMECGVTGSVLRGERSSLSLDFHLVNIRDYSPFKYKNVDDSPFGGGPGMVMRADILRDALIEGVLKAGGYQDLIQLKVIYTSPRGKVWNYQVAREFSLHWKSDVQHDLVFVCGRYEGIDERFIEKYVQEIYSLGDFVLTGGEIAIMAMIDSALRFNPGSLGNQLSSLQDSFEDGLLEHPQYTRPLEFEGMTVPEVLLSGHHKNIENWQLEQRKTMTQKIRPKN